MQVNLQPEGVVGYKPFRVYNQVFMLNVPQLLVVFKNTIIGPLEVLL